MLVERVVLDAALGDIAEFINGAAFKPTDWEDSGAPIIRIQNLTDRTKPFNRTTRTVSDKVRVRVGDLLVSWSATLGVFVWDREEEGVLNQHIFRVVPDSALVLPAYLRHMLIGALADMGKHLHGATMLHVNRGEFLATRIPLPSLPEQRRIAAILDQADEVRIQRRRALALLDEFAESSFETLIGAGGGGTIKLSELADIQTGPFGSLLHREDYISDGIPLVNPMHIKRSRIVPNREFSITESKLTELERYALRPGDVVLGRRGEMGRAAEVLTSHGQLVCGTGSMIVRPKFGKATGAVLSRLLSSSAVRVQLEQAAQGVTMLNLNQAIVGGVMISAPDYPKQVRYAETRDDIDRQKLLLETHLAYLDELFDSLQNRAFVGEL